MDPLFEQHHQEMKTLLIDAMNKARDLERERCAKIVEVHQTLTGVLTAIEVLRRILAEIRQEEE